MKHLTLLITLIALLLIAAPAIAQEAESTAEPIAVDAPVVNITVEEGGTANVESAPDPATDEPTPVTVVETPDVSNDTLLIVGVLIVGFISLAVVIARGGSPDTAAANQFNAWQMNREFMEAQERAYQNASAERKVYLDTAATLATALAPLTTFLKSDDALARYLRDVQTPGPEEPPPAAP